LAGFWSRKAARINVSYKDQSLTALLLVGALCLATLTLWIAAYWPVAAFEICVFCIAGVLLLQRKMVAREAAFPLYMLGLLVVWGTLQMVTGRTINRFSTERATLQWMTWAAFYYAGAVALREEPVARLVRTVIVWFAFALTTEAILQAYLSPGLAYGLFPTGYHDFVMGPIVYHTHFAAFVECVFPVALVRGLRSSGKPYLYPGISSVLLTGVVVSASRAGILLVLAEALAVVTLTHFERPKDRRKSRSLVLVLLALTVILVMVVGFQSVSQRFASESLAQGRVQFALSSLHMIAARPFWGWGLGCWQAVYPAFATFDPGVFVNQAHSDWLQWTAEGGLPVVLAMLCLAVWSIRPAIRTIWGIGVLAVLIHAAFDYPFSRPAVGAWPILILAMAAVNASRKSETSEAAEASAPIGPSRHK
jgi:O-antigen ligase